MFNIRALVDNLKGDKVIWSFVALLAMFSFMPVFSASSNLAYIGHGTGNTLSYLTKHFILIFLGGLIIFFVHKFPYHYYKSLSIITLPVVWVLLLITLIGSERISGAGANRWIQLPFVKLTFQTSTLAMVVLLIYVARYLSKKREIAVTFKMSLVKLWLPVFITLILILPANFSTTAMIFAMVVMLAYIGMYPTRYLLIIIGSGLLGLAFFVMVSKIFPESRFFNRVGTWQKRIENYVTEKPEEDKYQIEMAKIAIASGDLKGLGPGKSVQKNFLPQSSTDFIFAIIIEEYGLIGGVSLILVYILLFIRLIIAATRANTLFGKLLIVGLGFPIIFQAMVNMAVAVELLPVTGQTLPLVSSGGTSIWMVCFSMGIIINVTKKQEEIALEAKEAAKREEAINRLIEKQLREDEENNTAEVKKTYTVEDKSANPMDAVFAK